MASTNVPSIVFTPNGVILPQEPDILAGVIADINTAFGGGVDPSLTTPQGQLAQSQTAIIGDKNNQIAEVVNNINPDVADGRWQDAIGRIYFLDRIAASGSIVTGTCIGAVGTVIPAGSVVKDTSGYLYSSTSAATIGASGSVNVQFQNQQTGAIACSIGALSTIYTNVIGWDSVSNTNAASLGTNVETRADFEFRRRNSVALNAVNSTQAIYANVLSVPNVIDAFVVDNPTGASINYGATNYTLVKNSVVVSVAGGASANIAKAIWYKKSQGCNYNGNTSYVVQDNSGYNVPYPSYTVTWLTPSAVPVFFAISIANNPKLPSNIVALVQNAVIAAFNGADGGTRARIGSIIYSGRYYAGVNALDPNMQILSILMGTETGARTFTSIAFGIDQLPNLSSINIAVTLV
jgi:hypothetical protein